MSEWHTPQWVTRNSTSLPCGSGVAGFRGLQRLSVVDERLAVHEASPPRWGRSLADVAAKTRGRQEDQICLDLGSASTAPWWCHCCQPSSTSPSVAGAWRFSMPLDGTVPWAQPLRWTIRVRLAPHLLAESRHWSPRKLRVFHRLAADTVYAAIDAIQRWDLHTRREKIRRRGSWVHYLFELERETRTIRITISKFHFYGPAPPRWTRAPAGRADRSRLRQRTGIHDRAREGILAAAAAPRTEFNNPPDRADKSNSHQVCIHAQHAAKRKPSNFARSRSELMGQFVILRAV